MLEQTPAVADTATPAGAPAEAAPAAPATTTTTAAEAGSDTIRTGSSGASHPEQPVRFADRLASFRSDSSGDDGASSGVDGGHHHSHQQPREQGRFAGPPAQSEGGEGAEAADAAGAGDAAQASAAQGADAAGDGNPGTEGTEAGAEAGAHDAFVLNLPGRRPDEPDVPVELEGLDQQTRERFQQMRNGFMRGEEVRQAWGEIEAGRDELVEIRGEFATDPVHFLGANNVHPSIKLELAQYLLADLFGDPKAWDQIADLTEQWGSDRDAAANYLRSLRDAATERESQRPPAEFRQAARQLRQTLNGFVPADASDADAREFLQLAESRIVQHVTESGKPIHPKDVGAIGAIIKRVADSFGYTAPGTTRENTSPAPAPARASVRSAANDAAPPRKPVTAAAEQGAQLVEASARRREVTITPPGPVAATTGGTPPQGGFKARLDWMRGQR